MGRVHGGRFIERAVRRRATLADTRPVRHVLVDHQGPRSIETVDTPGCIVQGIDPDYSYAEPHSKATTYPCGWSARIIFNVGHGLVRWAALWQVG